MRCDLRRRGVKAARARTLEHGGAGAAERGATDPFTSGALMKRRAHRRPAPIPDPPFDASRIVAEVLDGERWWEAELAAMEREARVEKFLKRKRA